MVYLLKMVFHGKLLNNQMVIGLSSKRTGSKNHPNSAAPGAWITRMPSLTSQPSFIEGNGTLVTKLMSPVDQREHLHRVYCQVMFTVRFKVTSCLSTAETSSRRSDNSISDSQERFSKQQTAKNNEWDTKFTASNCFHIKNVFHRPPIIKTIWSKTLLNRQCQKMNWQGLWRFFQGGRRPKNRGPPYLVTGIDCDAIVEDVRKELQLHHRLSGESDGFATHDVWPWFATNSITIIVVIFISHDQCKLWSKYHKLSFAVRALLSWSIWTVSDSYDK